jgi:small-conductance mechanosensitive channel
VNYEKIQEIITTNLLSLIGVFTTYLPRILFAIILLLVGYLISKIASRMLAAGFRKMGLDKMSDKVGFSELLSSWNIKSTLSQLVNTFLFVFFFTLFLMSVADILEMKALSGVFDKLFSYLPNIVGAFVVFMGSAIAGHFAKNFVFKTLNNLNLEFAKPLSNIVYFALMLIGVILALSQLKIETAFLTQVIQIILIGIVVALALSLGIGSRDVSKNLISGVYLKDSLREGAYVKVGHYEGTLVSIRPVCFELQDTNGKSIILPNSRLLEVEIVQNI